jgi:hypothetical protein
MACTACLVCLFNTVNSCSKKALKEVAQLAGTKQTLINEYFLSISNGHQSFYLCLVDIILSCIGRCFADIQNILDKP